jgi:DNA-binding transcriptional regulator YdaS (Cro superfamily)
MKQVIEFFGSKSAMAKALGVDKAAVSQWLRYGLPPARAIEIEKMTNGEIKAVDIVGVTHVA